MPYSNGNDSGPLSGLVILDLTRALSGPYCTLQLAELGARVIKVESPGTGDEARGFPPLVDGSSIYFRSINRNKESIDLDLKCEDDKKIFDALLPHADVLVENFRPGVLERLGYGWESLHATHPTLVLASISGFGQDGPNRERTAYDMVAQAMGGIMSITGQSAETPTRVGVSIGDLAAGLFAAIGIQAALWERARTGVGTHVDIAMLDCQVALMENAIARYCATGDVPKPMGSRHPLIAPFDVFRTADSSLAICIGNEKQFAQLAKVLDVTDWLTDPRFASIGARNANQAALKTEMEVMLMAAGRAEWLEMLDRAGVPCGPVNNVSDLVEDMQVEARQMLLTPEGEREGMRYAAMPYKISSMPRQRAFRGAPQLGAQRQAILQSLGLTEPSSAPSNAVESYE